MAKIKRSVWGGVIPEKGGWGAQPVSNSPPSAAEAGLWRKKFTRKTQSSLAGRFTCKAGGVRLLAGNCPRAGCHLAQKAGPGRGGRLLPFAS